MLEFNLFLCRRYEVRFKNFVYLCSVMWLEKLGNYFIDVSKYVLTGVVITSFFKDFGESKLTIYGVGTAFAIIILIVGLILTNKKDNNIKKKEDK